MFSVRTAFCQFFFMMDFGRGYEPSVGLTNLAERVFIDVCGSDFTPPPVVPLRRFRVTDVAVIMSYGLFFVRGTILLCRQFGAAGMTARSLGSVRHDIILLIIVLNYVEFV